MKFYTLSVKQQMISSNPSRGNKKKPLFITVAAPLCSIRQRMTMDFAPASAANSGEAAAGICTGYFPAAASLLFTLRVMLAFSKQSKLLNLAQPNSVFFSPISLAFTKEMGNYE